MTEYPNEAQIRPFRPIPFYFVTSHKPEEVSYEAAYEQLSSLKENGFGGIVLFNKPPHGFDAAGYLSDSWFSMVKNFVKAAAELELSVWINDGFNFPPGDAGGRIRREDHPELTQKRIRLIEGEVQVQETSWGFPAFEEPKSAELFHQYVYEPTKAAVGSYFGTTVKGFFSDADNRRVSAKVFAPGSEEADFFPWSNNFAGTFAEKYGYDITPHLKTILKKESCAEARDYWEHAGFLYQQWFVSNKRWCEENGLEYTFHTSDSSPYPWADAPRCSAFTEGRALDMESIADYPGTDQELLELNGGKHMRQQEYWVPKASWGGGDAFIKNPLYRDTRADLRTKQVQSAAFLQKKKGAMCEMFAATNWGATYTELREIAARQIMQGITFIVPHAYHHRLLGDTKYFAPPDFSSRSKLRRGVKELNDTLAKYCSLASQGTLKVNIAVLDITDDIWQNKTTADRYFDACLALDHAPCGYVIADDKRIAANKDAFTAVLNTGAPLNETRAAFFEALGLPVVETMEELTPYTACSVRYEGEGTPHFMRRELNGGKTLALLCNLEQDAPIRGRITVDGASFETLIHPGEIVCFTKDGPFGAKEPLTFEKDGVMLDAAVPVKWERENVLPLERWENEQGETVTRMDDAGTLILPYTVCENAGAARLWMTKRTAEYIDAVLLDGEAVAAIKDEFLLDDEGVSFLLPQSALKAGEHVLMLKKHAPLPTEDPIFLFGEFDVTVETAEDYHKVCFGQYSLTRFIPKQAKITLSKRRETLDTAKSFTEQGHPFYSGGVTYRFAVSLPDDFGEAVLHLPQVRDTAVVTLDGKEKGIAIHAPYDIALGRLGGGHTLDVTVMNTPGNMLEFYRAPSGLLDGGVIAKRK